MGGQHASVRLRNVKGLELRVCIWSVLGLRTEIDGRHRSVIWRPGVPETYSLRGKQYREADAKGKNKSLISKDLKATEILGILSTHVGWLPGGYEI